MSYLLFMDESGHDHRQMPYEVRGGLALHASNIWSFVREMAALEQDCFGDRLYKYNTEIKGHKLLDKDRFRWALQMEPLDPLSRRQNAVSFLRKGLTKSVRSKIEFTAYGQASIAMARGIFDLLAKHSALIFAAVIPSAVPKPTLVPQDGFLRKDHVFMLQRFFYHLDNEQQTGLLVMDETDKALDRKFVQQMEAYFTKTAVGQERAKWIVPSPFFVSSDMAYPVQVADVCLYCINCSVRIGQEMTAPVRHDIDDEFRQRIMRLQWQGVVDSNEGRYGSFGIVYVPDPYTGRR